MKVIFLDCDGVLNTQFSKSFFGRYVGCDDDKLERLKRIVDATGAKIVVSSTWRLDISRGNGNFNASGIYQYLLDNLKRYDLEVYDITPECSYHRTLRGTEIRKWLEEHPEVTEWVVLDDEYFGDFSYQKIFQHLVETNFYIPNGGLQDEHVAMAIHILNGGTKEDFEDGNELLLDNKEQ